MSGPTHCTDHTTNPDACKVNTDYPFVLTLVAVSEDLPSIVPT